MPKKLLNDALLILPVPRQVKLGIGEIEIPKRGADIEFLRAENAPADLRNWASLSEGYGLVIDKDGVHIYAGDVAGRFYGEITLKQLIVQFGRNLPMLEIGDSPVMAHRGATLTFPQGHTEYRRSYMRHLVPKLALWKINALYLYLETYFDFPSLPHFAGPGAMTAEDARDLDSLCKAHNIKLIPMLNTLGHCGEILGTQRYHELIEHSADVHPATASNYNLCACNPKTHELIDVLLGDIMDCFSSDIIHVGGDEVYHFGECELCKDAVAKRGETGLYLDYLGRIRDMVNARGRKIGIWGDMLLQQFKDSPVADRKQAFARIAAGTIIYDWHYVGGSPDTLKFFVDSGLETIACSSTNLAKTTSFWMGQSAYQRMLFGDAIAAGAVGGITTAWLNYVGLHEEQCNYLHASGGTALWSGPEDKSLAPGLSTDRFDRAYSLQRYGLRDDTLTKFWHTLGDAKGPVLQALKPLQGVNVRKCIFHTDNVLAAWMHYSGILQGEKLEQYRSGIREARMLWEKLTKANECKDPYMPLQVAPLLTHEHMLRRFETIERVYSLYNQAAQTQYNNPKQYESLLDQAATILLKHLDDFAPLEQYLKAARRSFGLEQASLLRLRRTKAGIRKLSRFFRHLAGSDRPLPAFVWLHDIFLSQRQGHYYLDREHEWASGPIEFRRYGILKEPWAFVPMSEEAE